MKIEFLLKLRGQGVKPLVGLYVFVHIAEKTIGTLNYVYIIYLTGSMCHTQIHNGLKVHVLKGEE